ncbi:centrosome-associated protein ALMS1 [Pteronotus mesoamericanus]|uniref:centrosome-associated protein ALMS1 n=1 Tax=Pteronotus mesoamericanus TaxID=1884717 RepID=UPI0023EBCE9D|nr:centrosome-associated protein ALMS1 [Pteronotus parnellii mesoamericanus]
MEPEDLPWPGELEEEEEEEEEEEVVEEEEEKKEVGKPENLDEAEVVMVEDVEEEERRELDADFNYENQPRESTDDEDDEEAKAWLQAHPGGTLPSPSLPKHRYSESESVSTGPEKVVPLTSHVWQQSLYQDKNRTPISESNVVSLEETAQWGSGDDLRTESWHFLPQEIDSSHTSDTTQTRFKVREEGTEMTDFPSVEEGILTQSENQVKEPNRDLFCSPLLVIQDSFASPDLPLLTCLTQDQEFGPDSLFHQSELDFAALRGIPGKSEDTEWFSRPSKVSEALFQAASEVASDLVNSHFSVSQHTLTGSTVVDSQSSFLHSEQGNKEETISSDRVDEPKTPKDSDSYDALCSYMPWKIQEVTQEPETTLANKDQLSFSTSSDTSDEYVTPKESGSFDACLYVQYWKQEALQQSEKYLICKDHDSCLDSSDTVDENKTSEGSGNFSAPFSCMPWSKQGASYRQETCAVSKDHVSFPHEVAPHFNNNMSYSFLHCLLERRGKSVALMSDSHYFESIYLRAPAENEVKKKRVSLESYERNEEGLGKELSQCFELKENSNTVVFSEVCPRSSEIQYIGNVVVPDNSVKVSETQILSREHDISKVETSGDPLQTITFTLDETSEQLYIQEERNQKASAAFGGKNVNATENVAFEAVIASVEPSKKENTVNEIHPDIDKSLTNYSQDSEPKNSDLFLLNYNDASSLFDKFCHPHCQSTSGVLEPAASKPLLHKTNDDVSFLYWHTNIKSLPSAPQEMFIRPLSSASLSEKSHSQVFGLCKTQSPIFQCDVHNEPFLPIAEKSGSSNIIYPLKVSTSDSLFLQDLKQQAFEEVADSSNYILGKNANSNHVIEAPLAAIGSRFLANLVAYDAKSQGALPMISDASLIAIGQETLLKADIGLGEIPQPMGAKSSFTIHTIMQNDSYLVEDLQGKSESDIGTLGDDTECCSLDENAVVCNKRSTELQREMCDQGVLTGECIELACLENLLDDLEICDSSLPWQSALQEPSKEESSFEEPVGHSNTDVNQSFSSVLPPFVPHEPNRELEYHSSDLRMLRVSPEIVPKTLKHLSGDISEGGITEITQSNLKAGFTTTSGDSDIGSYLPLTPEDFPQLAVRSSVENTLGLHTDSLNKQLLADGHVTEEALKVLAVPELADQRTGISTLPSSSYSLREKPGIFYPQPLRNNHLSEGALRVSAVPGPIDQKTSLPTVSPGSYLLGEKHSIFYQQVLPDSDQTEEPPKVSAVLGRADQKSEKTTETSSSFSHRQKHVVFSQQQLPDSHLTEQVLKVSATPGPADQVTVIPTVSSTSYPRAEKTHIFYRQTLPESHLTEQALKVSAVPGFTEQKTGIPTVSSTSYSYREKPSLFYQRELPESHLPDQSPQAAAVSVFTDQKTGILTGTSTSYSHGEKPHIFYRQALPGSHLTEQALKVSAAPGSTEQKTGIPTVSSASYSHREKPSLFYQQELPESQLPDQSQQAVAVSGFADQKTEIPTGTSTSYSHGEKATIFYQQELRDSHLSDQSQKAAAVSVFADQKTGIPTGTSASYSHGEKPHIFYQQTLPEGHLTEQALKVSPPPGLADQRSGIPTVTSTSYSHREAATIFYQQEPRDSHLSEQSQQAPPFSVFTDQKTGIPTGTSASYSHGEKPHIFYQQTLPEGHLTEQALKVSPPPGLADQRSGIPTVTSTSYSHREAATIFYQQEPRDSHLSEQSQQAPPFSVFTDQKTGIPTGTSASYSHGEKPHIFYQQTLPEGHLTEQALKVSPPPGLADQRSGIPTVTSTYSHREKPNIIYQQELPVSHLTKEAQKVPGVPGPAQQKTGIPVLPPTSYSHRGKTSVFYQQELPDGHLTEQAQRISPIPEPADQNTGLQTVPYSAYSHREKPIIFYQQEFPDSHLTGEALKVQSVLEPAEKNSEIPSGSSGSYSFEEKLGIFYQQALPDSHLTEESLEVSSVPGPGDQKTGTLTVPSSSNSHREKPSIFYQQELPDSHLTEQAQKVSAVPGPTEQKSGISAITSTSHSHREKPFIFYPQGLTESHLPEEDRKVIAVPGPADQKAGLPSELAGSYSHTEKPIIFYPQALPDTHLTEEALKVSITSGPGDQKTGIPTVPSASYPQREKHIFISPQALPHSHLLEEALKASAVSGPADQKIGLPSEPSGSYSHREKPVIFYPQGLTESHLPEEDRKVIAVPGPADRKAGLPSELAGSYSHTEKPIIFYPQALPDTHLTEEALKVSITSGPGDQKTGIPTVPSASYPQREKHIFISPQALPHSHLLEEALKASAVSGPADQKIGLPSEPSGSYSHREKPVIFYTQGLTESHLPEGDLKVSAVPGPADRKIGLSSEPSGSYSHKENSSIFYYQELPDSHLTEEAPKVSPTPGTGDQKTGIPTVPTSAYSIGGKSVIFYQQALPGRHVTEEALNVSASPGPPEQKTGIPTVSSTSYSQREKPFIFYPQALPDSQLTEEALKVSAIPLPGDQNTRKTTATSTSYLHREKPIISYQQELPGSHLTEEALKASGVPGTADQKTGIPTVPSSSYSYREKPIIPYQQDLTQEALKALGVSRPPDQKTGIAFVTSTSYSHEEKPISYQQELPDHNEDSLKLLAVPGPVDQKTDKRIVPSSSYSHRESSISSYQKEFPDITEKTLEISAVAGPADQKTGIRVVPSGSYSYREKGGVFYQYALPDTNEEALKVFALPGPAGQKTEIPVGPSSSYSLKEKPKISTTVLPDDQKPELPTAPSTSHPHREKPKNLTVVGPDNQKTPLLTVFRNSYSQRVKPGIFLKQHSAGGHHREDILKASSEPTDMNSGIPVPISSSYSNREKSNILSPQELPEKHLTEDVLKVSTIPEPDDQKTILPTAPPSFFSHREKPNTVYQQDLPDRHLTEDSVKFSSGLGQVNQITGLSTVHPGTYSHSEKPKLVSDHVQRLIDNMDSSNSSIISNNMPLNSQADGRVVVNKPEPSGFEDVGSEEFQYTDNSSKTLKQIQTLLMEAENIALKRCNFPAPLVPFRDVSDISFIQSKKVVCFKEPPTTNESNVDFPPRKPFTEENPSNKYIQKDISTQTNLKCQRGIENWEFISSTTVRSPIQGVESKAGVALDETLRQYKAARSVVRSDPEGCSGTLGNKILIPMMTIIKSDSSSDASSCSWDSNSFESVSDVLLNLFPYASPKTSMTDSREEEGVSESDDGGGGSVDSLAAHVKNLLKCESSLNHAKQILRNAEEEECRVRARAWNLKFNMAHECGYSISELNEDDRRKVEEIKAKLFGQNDLSKGLRSPRGIGCKPEAVCSHVIIESHEKGCFRTLTAKQPQLDSHPCVFRSAEPLDIIRGQRSPLSWSTRHINLSKSLDQSNPHFKVWDSLQLQSHSPFQNFTGDDFKIGKDFRMPFREKMDPWLSELVEPNCVPPEEMDCHSSSQMLPPESMKKFTSITFSSHRHSKCFSDSSVLKVGVTEDSQCTGASVGVFNSHFTEEQSPPRDQKQKTSSPSLFKIISHSPDKAVTILAESNRQGQKLSVEHSYQEEKLLLERSDFKGSNSEPSTSTDRNKFKEVNFSDNHTLISMGRPSSTLGVKEKNVTLTPNPPLHMLFEQEPFEQSKAPHADHYVTKHHSPPLQHQHYVVPNLPCHIFLEKRGHLEQSKTPHVDHQMRENPSPFPQGQNYIASDLPSSIFLEQRQLFEQSTAPDIDHHIKKQYSSLPQGQDFVVENSDQHKPKSHISNINVETKVNNVVSQSAPNLHTLVTSPSTPPSNRKALSCVRITISPKTPSKLDSGSLDKRFLSLDSASKTRMNSEFNSDLQTVSSRSLEPTSKLLTSKPVAHDQESLGFLGPKSSPDFQVKQSLPNSNTVTKDLKTIPSQNSQIVTSRQTQVNFSDLDSNPEGTPISADRSLEEIKPPFSSFPGKFSSDAVTQITTESPGKTMFSSEIFINSEDHGSEISEPSSQKLGKDPVKFALSSSVQQNTIPHGTSGAQPSLLPYKPSGSTKMYYVPQLSQIPSSLDSKSDTTIESSHSGSNDAIAPDFPAQVLGTRDDDLAFTVNIKHKEGIYSKRAMAKASLSVEKKPFQKDNADAQVQVFITGDENLSGKNKKKEIYNKKAVTKPAQSEEIKFLQKDTAGSSDAVAAELSAQLKDTKIERPPDTKAIKQKEEIHSKRSFPKEAWTEDKESLQINIEESRCHSEFENTTHSVFRSAKFYFHHPVHLPSDQDFCHESLGRSVFMRHSWKDFFQHHPEKQHTCLPPPYQNEEKAKTDYTRIESVSINVNLENKEVIHPTKSQARDYAKCDKQINDQKKDLKVNPEPTTQHITSLNELWNKYQERQKQQKLPGFGDRKEVSLVERLDRLAKLLQNPITHSLRPLESTQDESRGQRDAKEWRGRQQQQKNKLQKKKRYKSLEKCHKNIGDLKKSKVLSTHQAGSSNRIKIEQVKFDKYILRKQPDFHYINSTSSDSRPSEDSELLTDTATNILSTTASPVESDILTQTDKEVTLHERSSSISTIDTARLIQAFGHERVCLSPRRIKLYSSTTDHQRRYIEKRSKNKKKALSTSYPQMTSEHTRRKRIQVANDMISPDSISSSTSSFWTSSSTLCNKQNVPLLNKGVQTGNLEIVNGVRKHTRDVGVIFPTPSSSEVRVEEDSDVTSWSEEKMEEKRLVTSYLGDKKLRKSKQRCYEGVSWFVPMEKVKSSPKKENLPKHRGPGISWFAPITNIKPWREPLREQNWQSQHTESHGSLAGPGRGPLKPFVRATLQESLQLHRPDFISRSGERIKRLKLIVQERKLQNILQRERETLFNTVTEWQGRPDPMCPLPKRGFLTAQKGRPVGKKEMIQRSKRIYEQLPEVQKKKEEEKRRLEYKSYRLRAQLYKKKVTNQLLGRKVPWD